MDHSELEKIKSELCINELNNHDNYWIKRKRKVNTLSIFENLIDSGLTNHGVSTCVNSKDNVSYVAVHKARMKLKVNIFKDINDKINHSTNES